jgi:hypothetical protein
MGFASSLAQKTTEPPVSKVPISSERLGIYRDFLEFYSHSRSRVSKAALNVSQTTSSFSPDDMDRGGCLKGFEAENPRMLVLHTLSSVAFPKSAVRLVDPATHKVRDPEEWMQRGEDADRAVSAGLAAGLFTFSEIVFDASHAHAAFSYSFHCGRLCGDGGVTIYEKKNGKWKPSETSCARFVS